MMISKTQIQQVLKQYTENTKVKKTENSGVELATLKTDSVMISKEALNVQRLQNALGKIPDVRHEKVRVIQEQIQSGTYNVSGEEIAGKMIDRVIVDRLIPQ